MIVFVFVGVSVFGLDHGWISGFEVGYNFIKGVQIDKGDFYLNDVSSESLYVKIKTGYRIGDFRMVGTYINTLEYLSIDTFVPIQDRYRIELNYTLGNFLIGAFHWCDHPVSWQNDERIYTSNSANRAIYISYYREY